MKLPKKVSSKRYLTIGIYEGVIRVAKINKKGNKFDHFSEYQLPPGLLSKGTILNNEGFIKFLASVKKASKQKDKECIVGVSELKATTHTLTMPQLDDDEMKQAIERQSESFLPFPYKDEYVDWMRVEELPDDQLRIILSALPRIVVDELTDAFIAAGYKPAAFENTALSLYRLIPDALTRPTIVVHQDDFATICLLGSQASTGACSVIQDKMEIDTKLPKLLNYYIQKNQAFKPPDTVYVVGHPLSSQMTTILTNQYKFKVVPLSANVSNIPKNRQMELAAFASLTRKLVAPPSNQDTINIISETVEGEYSHKKQRSKLLFLKLITFFVLVVLVGVGVFLLVSLMQKEQELKGFDEQEPVSANAAQNAKALGKLSVLRQVMTSNEKVDNVLELIQDQDNAGIRIKGVSYLSSDNQVLITGFANTRSQLISYQEALEETELFESVSIPITSLQKENSIDFRMKLTLQK